MSFATAKAYLDQLARGSSLTAGKIAAINADIDAKNTKKLRADAKLAKKAAATAKTPADVDRLQGLSKILASDGATTASVNDGTFTAKSGY